MYYYTYKETKIAHPTHFHNTRENYCDSNERIKRVLLNVFIRIRTKRIQGNQRNETDTMLRCMDKVNNHAVLLRCFQSESCSLAAHVRMK